MKKYPMTEQGFQILKDKIHKLKTIDRPKIIESIVDARKKGDLKENSEYHAAREQQSLLELKISNLENKLNQAHIIYTSYINFQEKKVVFSSFVSLLNLKNKKKSVYQIVGEEEANFNEGKISIKTPIAKALLGRSINDIVNIKTPSGYINYKIENITISK